MLTENPSHSPRYMRATALVFLAQALLLFLEGAWMMLNHKPHEPHYHNHHVHEACHSLAYVLGVLLIFYTVVILMIVLTKGARSELWAIRILGLPNFVFILAMAGLLAWLGWQYEEHDEHWFVFNLEMACALAFFFLSYFLFSFATNGLGQLRSYAKAWVMLLGLPVCSLSLIFYYENLPIHEWISFLSLATYALTLLSVQRGKVTKVLKQL